MNNSIAFYFLILWTAVAKGCHSRHDGVALSGRHQHQGEVEDEEKLVKELLKNHPLPLTVVDCVVRSVKMLPHFAKLNLEARMETVARNLRENQFSLQLSCYYFRDICQQVLSCGRIQGIEIHQLSFLYGRTTTTTRRPWITTTISTTTTPPTTLRTTTASQSDVRPFPSVYVWMILRHGCYYCEGSLCEAYSRNWKRFQCRIRHVFDHK